MAWEAEIEELQQRRRFAEALGGEDNLKRHHDQGRSPSVSGSSG